MKIAAALALWTLLHAQDDPSRQARELVEKLRSDQIDERDEAARKIKELGKVAIPELEKAAKNPDAEMSERAKLLLRFIEIRERLTPNLLKEIPAAADRLATGDDHAWTRIFLEAVARDQNGVRLHPSLRRPDLESLAAPAVEGAMTADDRKDLCRFIHLWR